MPRGRHRHSPPLHRMLPPSAIAGVSVVCALGPWVFTQPMVLRVLAAAAAVTTIVGAVIMRQWDAQAGKRVADLTRARAGDEWRFEERVAELESDLEESRELRMKLEQRLRAKRAELAGLRNEHASLLRRYAAAEVDRASVLEERRVLEIEATVPARALPAGPSAAAGAQPGAESGGQASVPGARAPEPDAEQGAETPAEDGSVADSEPVAEGGGEAAAAAPAVFSPEGSQLFLRADAALSRITGESGAAEADEEHSTEGSAEADGAAGATGQDDVADASGEGGPESGAARPAAHAPKDGAGSQRNDSPKGDGSPEDDGPEPSGRSKPEPAQEDEAQGQPEAAGDHERAAASTTTSAPAAQPAQRPSGHFTVPTAVAVVPATPPARRPVTGGGFDFFGTKKETDGPAMDAVQNEDLADVVGQEALALHKAEAEARYKPAAEETRDAAQVIDLTAHDETEHIDVEGLRSAVS